MIFEKQTLMHASTRSLRYYLLAVIMSVCGCGSEFGEDTGTGSSSEGGQHQVQLTNPGYLQKPVEDRCCVVIAHAGGGIEGNAYTNSLEAVEANYALGVRDV